MGFDYPHKLAINLVTSLFGNAFWKCWVTLFGKGWVTLFGNAGKHFLEKVG